MKNKEQIDSPDNQEFGFKGRDELILQISKLTKSIDNQSKIILAQEKKIQEQDILIKRYIVELDNIKIELGVLKKMISARKKC